MHFMIAEKSSDVKVKRVSRLAESKAGVVFHMISADFTKLFHAFVRPLFELRSLTAAQRRRAARTRRPCPSRARSPGRPVLAP